MPMDEGRQTEGARKGNVGPIAQGLLRQPLNGGGTDFASCRQFERSV